MIVNDGDLQPLNINRATECASASANEDIEPITVQMDEIDDSVPRLLIARAEAEEAEARAKAAGETILPYPKQKASKKTHLEEVKPPSTYTSDGNADDTDSPAPSFFFGTSDVSRLSDATVGFKDTAQDFLIPKPDADSELLGAIPTSRAVRMFAGDNELLGDESATMRTQELTGIHITELLKATVNCGASDLHLTVGLPPMVRKDGSLMGLPYRPASPTDTQRIVYDILTNEQIAKFERTHELDFSYGVKNFGRFRFNVYRQRDAMACAMRVIPNKIPTMDQLKLPPILKELTHKHAGLILVTGPTGSGKSTTIASMIDLINSERDCHILTIEDPVEYLHSHKRSMVNQRELGTDTDSFNNALRAALREDPDVILVGEMRDLETIAAAITLAETGHLVFATLHTRSAPATIDRIVDVFPSHQQEQIRMQLATSIEAVVAQQLLPKIGGGRIAAIEIMIATSALRNLIREGKTYQITSVIETGHQFGMQAMDRVLADLFRNGAVIYEEAMTRSIDKENFQRLVKGF